VQADFSGGTLSSNGGVLLLRQADTVLYLPLYVFVGDFPLWAQLRTSDKDGAAGVVAALEKIIPALRQRCRRARISLWLAALAYLLLERVRTLGLAGTELAQATVGSLRLKLLKVAAQVRVSVRRVYVQLSTAYPLQALFRLCQRRLMALTPASG
jgi:hypothetical protein